MSKFAIDPGFSPHTFALPDGFGAESADRKFPPANLLYPHLEQFSRVDAERYYTRDFMQTEWDRLWTKTWTCAGRAKDIPQGGNFFRYDLGRESFIIVRDHDDVVRAFYNVCQHRGRQLVDSDFGSRAQFVCPFHSWAYDLKGRNKRVTDRETFSERALCGDLDMKEVRCEIWGGFVFINMDPDAKPLMDFLSDVPELMAAYRLEDMHVVKDAVLEIDSNWKTGLEPFIESYHVHVTHPQALPMLDDVYEQYDVFRNGHARLATPLAIASPRMGDQDKMNDGLSFFLMSVGLDPAEFENRGRDVREAVWQAKRAADNPIGLDFSPFTKSQSLDTWNYFIFPNMTLNTHPEGVSVMRFLPHPTDPEKFLYHIHIIMPKLADGRKAPFYMGVSDDADVTGDSRPAREFTTMDDPQMGEVFEQDISNMVANQLGASSRGLPGGMRFAERELRVQVFHAELDLYLRNQK